MRGVFLEVALYKVSYDICSGLFFENVFLDPCTLCVVS